MGDEAVALARARTLLAIDEADALSLLGSDGSVRRLTGDSAALARAVLEHTARAARTRAEILAHVEALTGAPLEDASVVDALIGMLREARALVPARPAPARGAGARILLGLGGAVAAAHAPMLVPLLQARGHEVRVAATENALDFVAPGALEALTHRAVVRSFRQRDEGMRVPHIELAAWPDVMLVWPATAALVHRLATGDTGELVSAIAITTRAPVLVAPSMNPSMHDAPSVRRNLETLRRDGFALVPPTFAVEVADAPERRTPGYGGAPGPAELAAIVQAFLRLHPPAPRDAAGWEALHRRTPEAEQAWFTAEVDADVARAIDAHAPPGGRLWDVGTGHGATAAWAAARGFAVLATDASSTAVDRAAARHADARVTWLVDDVTETSVRGRFEVVIDRGTLHSLPEDVAPRWARAIVERTGPGAVVIVKAHAPPGDPRLRSHPVGRAALEALLGPSFAVIEAVEGAFAGTVDPPPPATTFVLRRG